MADWRGGGGVAALAAAGAVGVWLLLPGRVHVARSAQIAAPPATVFELLDDLAAVRRWSPWRDPRTRYLFSGPAIGRRARMDWSGADPGFEVIEAVEPYSRVAYRLSYAGRAGGAEFRLIPGRAGVRVDWRLERTAGWSPAERWRLLLFRSQAGPEMERGLDRLAEVAESLPRADLASARVRLADRSGAPVVEAVRLGEDPGPALAAARLFMGVHRLVAAGPARTESTADPATALLVSPVRSAGR